MLVMKFCPLCGSHVSLKIPLDDNRERYVCDSCHAIHYENPRNVVGTIPIWKDQILLCKRAIEPRKGYWTLPAGFLETGESLINGALRETLEESGAQVEIGPLFSLVNVLHVDQIHVFYLAHMTSPSFQAGVESLEVALFDESNIPWDDLAFMTVIKTLKWYFADRKAGLLTANQAVVPHQDNIIAARK